MNFFKNYIAYIKNNPEGYWFKRKLYGWGWVPTKWEGWAVIAVFIIFIVWSALDMAYEEFTTDSEIGWFVFKLAISLAVLFFICYKKGEKPKWQWGQNTQPENK